RLEVQALTAEHAQAILDAMRGSRLEAVVTATLGLGLRQGEALGLRWCDVDLDGATVTVRNQAQRDGDGVTFVPLQTERSRRTLALPGFVAAALRGHRTRQLEDRL